MSRTDSTVAHVRAAGDGPAPRWGRRCGLALLLVIVVLGGIGVLGVRSRTVHASDHGYSLSVTYPQTARAGLDVAWRARVHHPGGFPGNITLAISTDYFRMFETQGFYPDADSATNDGRFVYLTFLKPAGADFVVDYDAYIQPGSQLGKSATVKLIIGKHVQVQTHLRTWLVP